MKVEMSKIEFFTGINLAMKACLLNQSSFFIFVLFGCLLGHLLSRKMNHNIMGKVQKQFSWKKNYF